MKKSTATRTAVSTTARKDAIATYAKDQPKELAAICVALRELIDASLPKATSKVWHGSPVWFSGDNPVVGYSTTKKAVKLLFWNGRALDEPDLQPVGKYFAAEAVFGEVAQMDAKVIRRWLKKAKANVFDSQAFFKQLREARK